MTDPLPMPKGLPGTCDICGKEVGEVFVCSSSFGPISLAHCRTCLNEGAEALFVVDSTLWNGFNEKGEFSALAFHPGFLEGTSVYYQDRYMSVLEYTQQEGVLSKLLEGLKECEAYLEITPPQEEMTPWPPTVEAESAPKIPEDLPTKSS